MALVARIGEQGTPLLAGSGYQAPASTSGALFLAPNDDWYLTWGNSGSLPVTVCPGETPCTVEVTATVPQTAAPGAAVALASTAAAAASCTGTVTFDWDFGDGSPHGTEQNPSHTYLAAGSFTWTLTVHSGSASATRTGTILIQTPGAATCTTATVGAVPATPGLAGMWQATGVTIAAGQAVTVTASGTWSAGSGAVSADGRAGETLVGPNCPLAGAVAGALIGRIGPTGTPFLIGASRSWTAAASGELYLAPNDNWYTTWDNSGSLSVTVCR
jgi:hypothetical protein